MRVMNRNGFIRRERGGVPYYSCAALEELGFVRHGFSTRTGGVSPGGLLNVGHNRAWDAAANVEENRRRFMAALELPAGSLLMISQVHSDQFHIIKERPNQWDRRTRGDALATSCPFLPVSVFVADCFPILMADPDRRIVAAVHSGWRGTLRKILQKTIAGLEEAFGSRTDRLRVAIGPGIRSCCMEVGEEVADGFRRAWPGETICRPAAGKGKYRLDLPSVLKLQLACSGVAAENVYDLGACTRCRPEEFFSHRMEGDAAGRMMAVIACTDSTVPAKY